MVRKTLVSLVALACVVIVPAVTFAQGSGGAIAGVVKDTTGAVLPGVTVETTSPALIEKVRTVGTDDQGLYKIVDLRPGAYTVTFTLTGFSTFKWDGIELTVNFIGERPYPIVGANNPAYYSALKNSKTVIIEGDYDVFGDGTVVIKPTPGHTLAQVRHGNGDTARKSKKSAHEATKSPLHSVFHSRWVGMVISS
jgi:hypothetical protein